MQESLIKRENYFGFERVHHKGHDGFLFNSDYDEPTYLTVRIDFFPENILKRDIQHDTIDLRSNDIVSYDTMPCPLLDRISEYSTHKYLKENLGETMRADLLENFIKGLIDLSRDCPYYIKSVSGLNELISIDPKRGARIDNSKVITLKCMEGLDLRILSLLNMYKKIVWDDVYQRWILPDMMRYFKMNIYVSEFRIFHKSNTKSDEYNFSEHDIGKKESNFLSNLSVTNTVKKLASQIGSIIGKPKEVLEKGWRLMNNSINANIPTLCFECDMCEFDISDIFSQLNELSISNPKEKMLDDIEIKIKVGNIKEKHNFKLFKQHVNIYDDSLAIHLKNSTEVNIANITSDTDYIPYKAITEKIPGNLSLYNRTGIIYDEKDLDDINSLATEFANQESTSSTPGLLSNTLKNTVEKGLAWADNYLNDKVNNLMNTTGKSGISAQGTINAITSGDLFAMYDTFKTKANAMKELYPEVSKATNGKIDVNIFEGMLSNVASSTATSDTENTIKNISNELIQYGKTHNIESIDDYMNVLKDAIKEAELSKATSTDIKRKTIL